MSKKPVASANKEPGGGKPSSRSAAAIRLGFLVWDVSRLWRVVIDRALKPLGVTRSQYSVIAFLARRDGMTQTALAADLELTKVAVGGLLERMEAVGLIERRPDESDARVRRVYLSRKGMGITRKIRELADPIEAEMLALVADDDLSATVRTMDSIKDMLLEIGGMSDADQPNSPKPVVRPPRPGDGKAQAGRTSL